MARDVRDLKVGDVAWLVGHQKYSRPDKGSPVPMRPMRIARVGRKYLYVIELDAQGNPISKWETELRIDRETGEDEGDRRLYVDLEDYRIKRKRSKTWEAFCKHFEGYGGKRTEATTEDIEQAAKLLGLELKVEE